MDSSFLRNAVVCGLVLIAGLAIGYRRHKAGKRPSERTVLVLRVVMAVTGVAVGTVVVGDLTRYFGSDPSGWADLLSAGLGLTYMALAFRLAILGR